MTTLDREQLETLKRQIEEDFRLDLAAIERLQWRFNSTNGSLANATKVEPPSTIASRPLPTFEPHGQQQPDMSNSLAGMFTSNRR